MVKGKSTVAVEDFVTAFAQAKSAGEVAERTGLSKASVQAKASALRKAGVKLKRFPRGRKTAVDVDALNDLLGRLGALDDTSDTRPGPPAVPPAAKKSAKPSKERR
jgi:biotin operon repressor